MGQRLNIEIMDNGRPLANAYYHWSAYTETAIGLTKKILDNYNCDNDKDFYTSKFEDVGLETYAVHLLMTTGARLPALELQLKGLRADVALVLGAEANRDDGLIALSVKEMNITREWAEGTVVIDIGKEIIDFGVFTSYYDEESEETVTNKIEYDNHAIPFRAFYLFANEILNNIEQDVTRYEFTNGEILSAII